MTFEEALKKSDKVWIAAKIGIPGNSHWTWVPTTKQYAERFSNRDGFKWNYNEEYNDMWIGEFIFFEEEK